MIINKTKLKQALEAKVPVSDLNAEEQEIYFEQLFDLMKINTSEQEAAFRKYIQTH